MAHVLRTVKGRYVRAAFMEDRAARMRKTRFRPHGAVRAVSDGGGGGGFGVGRLKLRARDT